MTRQEIEPKTRGLQVSVIEMPRAKNRLRTLMLSALAGAAFIPASAALADDAQTQKLQQQVDQLQQQLQAFEQDVKAAKRQTVTLPANAYAADMPLFKALPGVKLTWGGFIEAAAVWRQRNEVSDGASDPGFSTIPFPNSPLYNENETRFSARQSRLSLLATGDISPAQHLAAYYEMDFLGAGVTPNNRESNSYNLRVRNAYATWDNDEWHTHFLAGQSWSLLTQNRVGITPRTENTPLSIDAQYVAGFNWARQDQFRMAWDWKKTLWLAVSAESPQTSVTGSNAPGVVSNVANPGTGSGLFNSTTSYSNDTIPDIIEKAALDPGWGHYEVVGIERWFNDRVWGTPNGAAPVAGAPGTNDTTMGYGIGGSVLLPVFPKFVDFQASVLTGKGLGRYGSAQLPENVIAADGSLSPLQTTQFLLGLVAHATPDIDVYAYYGQEQVNSNYWTTAAGSQGGYGNPAFANGGCLLEVPANSVGFNTPAAGQSCQAQIQKSQEFTIGFWKNLYKGPVGRVAFGAQYEYIRDTAFAGSPTAGATPNQGLNPNNNIVYVSLRYYPF
ncbi:MAG: hypothetical protein ACLPKB_11465 [Xanthobacteraceae bacterium]